MLDRFDVDLKRCMFCQLCEEACPTVPKSIWLTTKTYEMAAYDRNESLYLDIRKLTDWRDANVKPFTVVEQGEDGAGALLTARPAGLRRLRRRSRSGRRSPSSSRRTRSTRRSSCSLSFLLVACIFILAEGGVRRSRPDPRLRGRDHGALPLRDHAREPADRRARRKTFQHQWDVALLLLPVFSHPVPLHPRDGEVPGRGR